MSKWGHMWRSKKRRSPKMHSRPRKHMSGKSRGWSYSCHIWVRGRYSSKVIKSGNTRAPVIICVFASESRCLVSFGLKYFSWVFRRFPIFYIFITFLSILFLLPSHSPFFFVVGKLDLIWGWLDIIQPRRVTAFHSEILQFYSDESYKFKECLKSYVFDGPCKAQHNSLIRHMICK